MELFSTTAVLILITTLIVCVFYHYSKMHPYKKIVDGLMEIYNLNDAIGLKFYRVRVFHALLIYRHITSEQKGELASIVLARLCKTPWMKKFIREDLGLKRNATIDQVVKELSKIKLPGIGVCGDQIASFIHSPDPFNWIKSVICKIQDLREREGATWLSPDDLVVLRNTIGHLNELDTAILFNHFFGFLHPFNFYEDFPDREFTASEEMLKNTIMDYVAKYPNACKAVFEISPNTNKRALYRERALRSGKMLIEIKAADSVIEKIFCNVRDFDTDKEHNNINTVLSLLSYMGINYVIKELNPVVINQIGEKKISPLIDDKFTKEEALLELAKIKVDDMSYRVKVINCSHPNVPNKLTVVLMYSRIGRVYSKRKNQN